MSSASTDVLRAIGAKLLALALLMALIPAQSLLAQSSQPTCDVCATSVEGCGDQEPSELCSTVNPCQDCDYDSCPEGTHEATGDPISLCIGGLGGMPVCEDDTVIRYVPVGGLMHFCASGSDPDTCEENQSGPKGPDFKSIVRTIPSDGLNFSWYISNSACIIHFEDEPDCDMVARVTEPNNPFYVELTASDTHCLGSGADDEDESISVWYEGICQGPNWIKAGNVCPDSCGPVSTWHERQIAWSIVGNDLGCSLVTCDTPSDDPNRAKAAACIGELTCWEAACCLNAGELIPQSAILVTGHISGTITIRATDIVYPNCYIDQEVTIGCSGCSGGGSCSVGGGDARISKSLSFSVGLGKCKDGKSAGKLEIHAEHADAALASAVSLRYATLHEDVQDFRPSEEDPRYPGIYRQTLRQVLAPQAFANVVDGIDGEWPGNYNHKYYMISIYNPNDVASGSSEEGWELVSEPTPLVQWRVEQAGSPEDPNQLLITKFVEGSPVLSYLCVYTKTSSTEWQWKVSTRDTQSTPVTHREETENWTYNSSTSDWTRAIVLKEDRGVSPLTTVSDVTETWKDFNWGRAIVQQSVATGGTALVSSFGYYDTGADTKGRLKYEVNADGSWHWYSYDSSGRVAYELGPWKDSSFSPPTEPSASGCRKTTFESEINGDDDFVERTTEYVLGTAVSLFERITSEDGLTVTDRRCFNPTASSGSQTFLETVTVYLAADQKKPDSVSYPDGRVDEYDYQTGVFTYSATDPNFTVTSTSPNAERTLITHQGTSGSSVTLKSTMDTSVMTYSGHPVMQETYVYNGSNFSNRVGWTARNYDEQSRLVEEARSNQTKITHTPDCCGDESIVDANGIETTFVRDTVLNRVTSATKEGSPDIVTDYHYEAASGQPKMRTTVTASGTGSLESSTVSDVAGRTVSSTDEAGITTTYSYATVSGSGQQVTISKPSGDVEHPLTETTSYYADGRIKSVSGSGVVARFYDYGKESDGTTWTKVYTGSSDSSSPRWVKTTSDSLGRTISEERPAFDSGTVTTTYNYDDAHGGRLLSVESPGQSAPATTEYDEMGNAYRNGLDINDNGALNNSSTDRITEMPHAYVSADSAWWLETKSYVYQIDSDPNATLLGYRRERLTGFGTNVTRETREYDALGNLTTSTTTVNRSTKTVTETIDYPVSTINAQTVTVNGLMTSSTDSAGLTTTFGYDGLGRRTTVTDPRSTGGTPIVTTTAYNSSTGRVDSVTDPNGAVTTYDYDEDTGRLTSVENALGKMTYYAYTPRGEMQATWGDVPQPVWMQYDEYGQRIKLSTFRSNDPNDPNFTTATWPSEADPNDDGIADITTWTYDGATGLLTAKTYADSVGPTYTYTADGKLETRVWARTLSGSSTHVTTTYVYSSTTGELTNINYNDPNTDTPDVAFTYDRRGRQATVVDAVGTRTFAYEPVGSYMTESFDSGSLFGARVIKTWNYDLAVPGVFSEEGSTDPVYIQRPSEIDIGTSGSPTADYQANYYYDENKQRINRVSGPGLPSYGAVYSYLSNSRMVETISYKNSSTGSALGSVTRSFEAKRDLLASVESKWPTSASISKYAYTNDSLGRRTYCVRTGDAFNGSAGTPGISPSPHYDQWSYNDRNELTGSTRYTGSSTIGSGTADPNSQNDRGYAYDPIGNRTTSTDGAGATTYYCANNLNQYEQTAATSQPCASTQPSKNFDYDADGNLSAADMFATPTPSTLKWDAENRLIEVRPNVPQEGSLAVSFKYDYMGRRVEKKVQTYSSSAWSTTSIRRFVYYNWLPLAEYDGDTSSGNLRSISPRKYTWGLDLAGLNGQTNSITSAGGIGGLLAALDPNGFEQTGGDKKYAYFCDGNGNVTQLIDTASTGTLVARYEYDPYGNQTGEWHSGSGFPATNAYRYSSKYVISDVGAIDYGARILLVLCGRWASAETLGDISEVKDNNDYLFATNNPLTTVDVDGRGVYPVPQSNSIPHAGIQPRDLDSLVFGARNENPECCDRCELMISERFVIPTAYSPNGHGTPSHFSARVYRYGCRCTKRIDLAPWVTVSFGPLVKLGTTSSPLGPLGGTGAELQRDDVERGRIVIPCCIANCVIANSRRIWTNVPYNPLGPNSNSALEKVLSDCGLPIKMRLTDGGIPIGSGIDPGPSNLDGENYNKHCRLQR